MRINIIKIMCIFLIYNYSIFKIFLKDKVKFVGKKKVFRFLRLFFYFLVLNINELIYYIIYVIYLYNYNRYKVFVIIKICKK